MLTLLGLERSSHDVLSDVVLLGQVEELPQLAGSLWTTSTRDESVGQTIDLLLALLDDDERENAQVLVDDAALD
jgi:hypothetical protein